MRLCWRGQAFRGLNGKSGVTAGCRQRFCNPLRKNCAIAATEWQISQRQGKFFFCPQRNGHNVLMLVGSRWNFIMYRGQGHLRAKALKSAAYAVFAGVLLSPVLVPAVAAKIGAGDGVSANNWMSHFTPAGVDSRLAEKMRSNALSRAAFPFTPAGLNNRNSNTLTVAVRTDAGNAVTVRNALAQMDAGSGTSISLNNSSYQLTAAKGWQAFKLPATAADAPRLDTMLGKGNFRLDDTGPKKPSRFNTDVKVDSPRGAAPSLRGNAAAAGDYRVDVGGSFQVAKGVDVTAGVRYSRDSDRVQPIADERSDSEAVYVGTKIKF